MKWTPWWEAVDKALFFACMFLFIPFLVGIGIGIIGSSQTSAKVVSSQEVLHPKKKLQPTYYYTGSNEYQMQPIQHIKQIDCGWEKC